MAEITVTSDYGLADLQNTLKNLCWKAGVKSVQPIVFMLTDSQVKCKSVVGPTQPVRYRWLYVGNVRICQKAPVTYRDDVALEYARDEAVGRVGTNHIMVSRL